MKVKGTSYFGVWVLRKAFFTSCVVLHEQKGKRVTIGHWDSWDSFLASIHSPLPLWAEHVSCFDLFLVIWLALAYMVFPCVCTVGWPFPFLSDPSWNIPRAVVAAPAWLWMRHMEQSHLHRVLNMRRILTIYVSLNWRTACHAAVVWSSLTNTDSVLWIVSRTTSHPVGEWQFSGWLHCLLIFKVYVEIFSLTVVGKQRTCQKHAHAHPACQPLSSRKRNGSVVLWASK